MSQEFDPISADIPDHLIDPANPPSMRNVAILSQGASMNANVYLANGPGPHPTVVLLHGYPGNERNLDLAHTLRRAGWNVLFFHYRGAWGSGGSFSLDNALSDAQAAIKYVKHQASALRVDPERVVVIGHSMGAALALRTGAMRDDLAGVVALATARLAEFGRAANSSELNAEALYDDFDESRSLKGSTGTAFVGMLQIDPDAYNLVTLAPDLTSAPVLMVGAEQDTTCPIATHHTPVAEALEAAGVVISAETLPSDHGFSSHRIALTRILLNWLDTLP